MQVALTLFPGVSADECEAFTIVFEQLADVEMLRVGHAVGPVDGPGGGQHVDATFGEVPHPDVVVVPGGLGCARTAEDDELLDWLRCRRHRAVDWMVAEFDRHRWCSPRPGCSTTTKRRPHWLAASTARVATGRRRRPIASSKIGNIITCEGQITAHARRAARDAPPRRPGRGP